MAGKTAASGKSPAKAAQAARKVAAKPAGKAAPKKAKKAAPGTARGVAPKKPRKAAPGTVRKAAPKKPKKAASGTARKAAAMTAAKSAKKAVRKPAGKGARKAQAGPRKAAAKKRAKARSGRSGKRVALPKGYQPSDREDFMNPLQIEYFRRKLLKWREELLSGASGTLNTLSEENFHKPDMTDRAQMESDASLELRTRDRERKLISKIDAALRRIEDGSYGYCEETDEPIGLKRLEARPIASLTLDAQERHERMERVHRDD